MKKAIIWTAIAALAAGMLVGCSGENPEAGKPTDLPPGRTTADPTKEATNENAGNEKPATPL
jgi:hypothetical protein